MIKSTKSLHAVAAFALAGLALAVALKRRKRALNDEANQASDEVTVRPDGAYAIKLLDAAPVMGQEKYLGGVLGSDGMVYGIPGHAKRVLKINPGTSEVSFIGPSFDGKYKWLRGVLAGDG